MQLVGIQRLQPFFEKLKTRRLVVSTVSPLMCSECTQMKVEQVEQMACATADGGKIMCNNRVKA